MHISRKRTPTQTQYVINENIDEQVPIIKDHIGVLIADNLCWSKHIESVVSSPNKTLGLVKRICKKVRNTNLCPSKTQARKHAVRTKATESKAPASGIPKGNF